MHLSGNLIASVLGILLIPMLSGCIVVNGQPCLTSCDGLSCPGCNDCGPLPCELESPELPIEEMAQATIRPPHSRFHPVPTRPVFAPRYEYFPPEPEALYLRPSQPMQAVDPRYPMQLPAGEPYEEFPAEEIQLLPAEEPRKILPPEDLPPLPPDQAIEVIPADALPESVQRLPVAEEDRQPNISATSGPLIIDPSPQRSLSSPESGVLITDRDLWRSRSLRR